MEIDTAMATKLFFPKSSLKQVYFEAIANSFDANASHISLEIDIVSFSQPNTLCLKISDNGDGFTDKNYERFKTVLKSKDKLHKGVGRLVFLQYFKQINITSQWDNCIRNFIFNEYFDGSDSINYQKENIPNKTELIFNQFNKSKINSYDDIDPYKLKKDIIEHFFVILQHYKRESKQFKIDISLNIDQEQNSLVPKTVSIDISDINDMNAVDISIENVYMQDYLLNKQEENTISIYYHIEKAERKGENCVAFSVDGRTIPTNILPPSSFPDDYSCFFILESKLFDSACDTSRQALCFPNYINIDKLYSIIKLEINKILCSTIPSISENNNIIKDELNNIYPHLLGYFDESTVGVIDKDEFLNAAQHKFFVSQKEVLQAKHISEDIYEKTLDLASRSLTEYILFRDTIIKKLSNITKYDPEYSIHNLIVPRYNDFRDTDLTSSIYQNNAWILDDKFMTFRTILSERDMDTIISEIRLDNEISEDSGRPDIAMIFSADPNSEELVDVVIVEIKKKTDDEKENQYVINQLLQRAEKLIKFCKNIQRVWYYGIININEDFAERLEQQNWIRLYSKDKAYFQNYLTKNEAGIRIPTPIFLVSFDAIIKDASARNHAFLQLLRDAINHHSQSSK